MDALNAFGPKWVFGNDVILRSLTLVIKDEKALNTILSTFVIYGP